jgi:hypothetical protein
LPEGRFKPISACSPAELRAEAGSRLLAAQALIGEARQLFEMADEEGHYGASEVGG